LGGTTHIFEKGSPGTPTPSVTDPSRAPRRRATRGGAVNPATASGHAWDDYEPVYLEHHERLYRIALLLTGNPAAAEDIVSDVFIQVYRPWSEGRVDNFGAYAQRAVVNRFNSQGRRAGVVDRFVHRRRGDDRGYRDIADQTVERDALWAALESLPPRQRATVVLRFYEELSVDETAERLGVTSGTVKSQVSDAFRTLRGVLGGADDD
jgi:RNA polymerase sigma-70 factor (sigma-E family)